MHCTHQEHVSLSEDCAGGRLKTSSMCKAILLLYMLLLLK